MRYLINYLKLEQTLCLVLVLIGTISFGQEQGRIHIDNYSYKDYHAHEQNWDIIENNNGILYFANNDGVLEYDGVNWRLIELTNQSNTNVLVKDSTGKIYIGGNNEFGYLTVNNTGEIVYASLLDKLPKTLGLFDEIWSIEILDDIVYFFAYNYIFKLRDEHITYIETDHYILGTFTYNHQLYYDAENEGLKKIQNDSIVDISFGDFFKDKKIWSFTKTKDDKILGLDENNTFYTIDLSIKNIASAADFIQESYFEISKQIDNLNIYTYTIFNDGSFGFATFSGFYHISETGKLIRKLDIESGLLSDIIWNIYQDSSGLIWLSTDNGISKADINLQLYSWGSSQGIRSRPFDILRIDSTLYIASSNGLQYIKNEQIFKFKSLIDECLDFLYFKNPEDPLQPKYLINTYNEGIIEFNENKIIKLFKVSDCWTMLQSKSRPSLVYLGAYDGLYVMEFKDSKWLLRGKVLGIDVDIQYILEDNKGNIWLSGPLNGLFRITPSENVLKPYKVIHYGLNNNLPSLKENVTINLNDQLFFGTDKGLYRFSDEQNIFLPDSLFGITYCDGTRSISALRVDSVNRVWITGKKNGKTFFSVAKPNSESSYTLIDVPFAGMYDDAVKLLYVEPDSTIWFGSPEGVYEFKGDIPQGPDTYPCYIRKVELKKDSIIYFGNRLPAHSKVGKTSIDFKFNCISFHFASPFYFSENLTCYQTWLEGFEEEWSEWSEDTKIEYLNLAKGEYTIHVRAKNGYAKMSSEDVFQFIILPPWQRTWWAYTLFAFLVLAIVWSLIRINSARLKRQNKLLKQTVKERTANILNQKEKLLIQAEELKANNEELNLLNSTKDKFFTIISHDLKSPFNGILGFTNLLVKNYNHFDDTQKKEIINSLNKSSHLAYQLLENLLTWAQTQTGKIEINKEHLNLKELIETSIAPYKYNAYKKHIKISSDIPPNITLFIDRNTSTTFIANLVNNAIKYTHEGGFIAITFHENDDSIELHIKDTGVGMSPEVKSELFRIDKNISTKGTNNESGTGLGLILCKEFINKNGGVISVRSEVGKGSEFIITLPKS